MGCKAKGKGVYRGLDLTNFGRKKAETMEIDIVEWEKPNLELKNKMSMRSKKIFPHVSPKI